MCTCSFTHWTLPLFALQVIYISADYFSNLSLTLIEIVAFSDRAKEFRDINCEVVAVSIDSHFSHLAWTKQPRSEGGLGKVDIPLVADVTKEISHKYVIVLLVKSSI